MAQLKVSIPFAIERLMAFGEHSTMNTGRAISHHGKGRIRYNHSARMTTAESSVSFRTCSRKTGAPTGVDKGLARVSPDGIEGCTSRDIQSPEPIVGYVRLKHFASPVDRQDSRKNYSPPQDRL